MDSARKLLWGVGILIVALAAAKLAIPGLDADPALVNGQRFLFGLFMAVAVWMTIVRYGQEARLERGRNGQGESKTLPAARVYAMQKAAALLIGLFILAPLLVTLAAYGRFEESGGWVLLPITGIGPALYARELLGRKKKL
ncbi:MAG: hypothetical protein OEV92_04315 [Nitrospinota bacterium]|nr:hypothetical protein [Nitrospinota bacterium]